MSKEKEHIEQKRFSIQIPALVYEELEQEAKEECEKVPVVVRRAILKYLRSKRGKN